MDRVRNRDARGASSADGWLAPVRALDGVRGVAVLLVVAGHVRSVLVPRVLGLGPVESPMPGGFLGVDVFFVLSGLLITSLLVREHERRGSVALGRFWWHRALRLLPALWVLLAVHALYSWATGLSMATQWRSTRAALVYLSNWAWKWDGLESVFGLGHLWSLAVEFQFYLVWPLVVLALLRLDPTGTVLLGTTAAGVVLVAINRAVLFDGGDAALLLYQRTDTRMDGLLVGSLLALAWWRWPQAMAPLRLLAWPALAAVAYAVATADFADPWLYRWGFTAIALAVAAVLGAIVSGAWVGRRAFELAPLVLVGKVSYGLYLWHLPIFAAVNRYGVQWGAPRRVVVGLAGSAAAAAASWVLVESPVRRLRRGAPPELAAAVAAAEPASSAATPRPLRPVNPT
jgi:peptidoglycan/LPS O-acetylase OafA/YrhL